MNSLSLVRRRALVAATVTMGTSLLLILLYWRAVSSGALPSPAQPLMAAPKTVVSDTSVAKPSISGGATPQATVTSAAAKPATSPMAVATGAAATAPQNSKTNLSDSVAPLESAKRFATTNVATATTPVRSDPSNLSTDVTSEDERVARHWLANTNQRPTIKVHYQAGDILRLSTELGRGLLVAGSGRTNRHEVFLQSKTAKAPLFGPLTKGVSEQFSGYSLALGFSPVLGDVVRPLPAYFPDGNYDLVFVPDRALATEIFAKTASALRAFQVDSAPSTRIIFEGQLRLIENQPLFAILAVKQGTNLVSFASD
jgi:hypothetical protein